MIAQGVRHGTVALALLPQFIDPDRDVVGQMAVLAVTSVVIEFIVRLAYGAGAGRLHRLAGHPRFARVADRATGTMLVTAGVGLAAVRR